MSPVRLLLGVNNLATLRPDLAVEWHEWRNGTLRPCDVQPNTKRDVWWRGKCGHEWASPPARRKALGAVGCPFCTGKRVLIGFNDALSACPGIETIWAEVGCSAHSGGCIPSRRQTTRKSRLTPAEHLALTSLR